MSPFKSFNLPEALTRALEAMKFSVPTPIQLEAIPVALEGRDILGCAQTGTGKTAAFLLPLIASLIRSPDQNALILLPTRELAAQVAEVVRNLTQFAPEIRSVVLIGGMSMKSQLKGLGRSPRVIVATPGRLVDHLQRRTASLAKTEVLVLDEADRMLDMGFARQLQQILNAIPQKRQTLLFSATLPPEILQLSRKYLKDPVRVSIGKPSTAVPQIEQTTIEVSHQTKNGTLLDQLNARQGTVLVFARTQARTDRVTRYLQTSGVSVASIHGGRTQIQRTRAMDGFRSGAFRVLVATDIAARGIDVDHVAHVINYDLPMQPEDYLHRIGRTGRAGRSGQALSFITPEDRGTWRAIDRLLKQEVDSVGSRTGKSQNFGQKRGFQVGDSSRPRYNS